MSSPTKIAVVLGSTRPGRKGEAVAQWVLERARSANRADATFELLDLARFDLSLLAEPTVPGAANRNYESLKTRAWSAAVDPFDGFLWVSAEYNHGVPAALKNGLDLLYPEWTNKGFGLVTYGSDGGVRAAEQWRGIIANVLGIVVRHQVTLYSFHDWDEGVFAPLERRGEELSRLIDQLIATTRQIRPLADG